MIKTKKQRIVNEKALIATVDISKDRHFGYWRCPDGIDVKPFSFPNNGIGFFVFWERRSRAREMHRLFKENIDTMTGGRWFRILIRR